jgi:GT2 family glycosyltransferase
MSDARVMIAVPNLGQVHVGLAKWLIRTTLDGSDQWSTVGVLMPDGIIPHDSARNFVVQTFLKGDNTHLFFLDSDVVPPLGALDELLKANVPIITGCYAGMRKDTKEGVWKKQYHVFDRVVDEKGMERSQPMWGEGVQPIRRCGAGCLLIAREVLEAIDTEPWFKFQYDERGNMKYGEDIDFCMKAEEHGYVINAHFGVICEHAKTVML